MKNNTLILLLLSVALNLHSQDALLKDSIFSFNEKLQIQVEYDELLEQAICNPTYRKIKDTLGYDLIEQRLYPNGQVYYQYFHKNGEITKDKGEFYPNGQVKYRGNDYDSLLYTESYCRIYYDIFGDTMQIEQYINFKGAIFQVKIEYGLFGGGISHVRFYFGNEQLYHAKKSFVVSFFCTADGGQYFYETYGDLNYKKYKSLLKTYFEKHLSSEKCKHIKISKIVFRTPFLENRKINLYL